MDFKAVFKLIHDGFQETGIDYAIIGGFALASAGYPRATIDIDFIVDKADMSKVKKMMLSFGYEIAHESEEVSGFVSRLDKLGRVDFLHAHRKYARSMLARAKEDEKLKIKVVLPEDLIGLKVQSSSNDPERYHQDMADIEAIIKANKGKLNMSLIKEYFELFNRKEELDQILGRIENA